MNITPTETIEKLLGHFTGLGQGQLDKETQKLERLLGKISDFRALFENYDELDTAAAKKHLETAENILVADSYKIVVVGETGAGKSTLINALMSQDLLPTGIVKATTGVASYIYPNSDVTEDEARIIERTDQEYKNLLHQISSRYKVKLANTADEITAEGTLAKLDEIKSQLSEYEDAWVESQLPKDLEDIARTWKKLSTTPGNLSKTIKLDNKNELNRIKEELTENSSMNKSLATRIIPGIERVEYHLSSKNSAFSPDLAGLSGVTFIDIPGTAADTFRHFEILKQELDDADAVIFVLKAVRTATQEAQKMVNLLERVLLGDYSSEAKTRFAKKIFLVVNRADELRGQSNAQQDLIEVVSEFSEKLVPGWFNLYGEGKQECRYFQTISDISLFASQETQLPNLNRLDDSVRGQIVALGEDPDNPNWQGIIEKSGVSQLSRKLCHFLCHDRLTSMIDEAEHRLTMAEDSAWVSCETALGKKVRRNHASEIEGEQSHLDQEICRNILKQQFEELKAASKSLFESLDDWLASDRHQKSLSVTIHDSFQELINGLRGCINALPDSDVIKSYRGKFTGGSHEHADAYAMLERVDRFFLEAIEENSRKLAAYYLKQFSAEIETQGLYTLFKARTYDQDYVKTDDRLVSRVRQAEQAIKAEYEAIFKYVLMYELSKMPILPLPLSSPNSLDNNEILQTIFREIVPSLAELGAGTIKALAQDTVPWPLLIFLNNLDKAVPIIGSVSVGTEQAPNQEIQLESNNKKVALLRERLLNTKKLVSLIPEYVSNHKFSEAANLLEEQFRYRYSIAVSTSLLFLERLFRYQVDKYCSEFDASSDRLQRTHLAHIDIAPSTSNIKEALLKQDESKLNQKHQAIQLLVELDKMAKSDDYMHVISNEQEA